jgi:hypothetical protein
MYRTKQARFAVDERKRCRQSTLAMLCASRGMDFLTEDATFVAPDSMLAG